MRFSDEVLMAYADGELDAATRGEVDAAITTEPEVARRVNQHKALRARIGAGFAPLLEDPLPAKLVAAARGTTMAADDHRVLPFRGKTSTARAWPRWGALAASFVLGALLWYASSQYLASEPIQSRHGQLVASGALAAALTHQLAADQSAQSTVQLGVSFRARSGNFCRTFQLRDTGTTSGVACHENNQWQLQALVHEATASAAQPAYRQAASSLPPAVLQTVNDSIAGEPLGAADEVRARARHWSP
jgi:hypothetical protein